MELDLAQYGLLGTVILGLLVALRGVWRVRTTDVEHLEGLLEQERQARQAAEDRYRTLVERYLPKPE